MGTQQILLIVLSVVIVGIAVAVGITMFKAQSENSAKQAIISDMNNFAATAMAFYKTPTSQGGTSYGAGADWTNAGIAKYIGIGYDGSPANGLETENATYLVTSTAAGAVTFTPTSKGMSITVKALTIDCKTGAITLS